MDTQHTSVTAGRKKDGMTSQVVLRMILGVLYILLNVVFYVVIFLVGKYLCEQTYHYAYQIFGNVSVSEAPGTDVTITITEGESSMEIATMLEKNRIVVNRYTFYLRTKLTTSKEHPIYPGVYTLNTSMCYDDILTVITDITQANAETEEKDE